MWERYLDTIGESIETTNKDYTSWHFEKIMLESSKKQWVNNNYLIENFLDKQIEINIGESND